jgi:hypothetical protein
MIFTDEGVPPRIQTVGFLFSCVWPLQKEITNNKATLNKNLNDLIIFFFLTSINLLPEVK